MDIRLTVHLNTIDDVKNFVKTANSIGTAVFAKSGDYTVDAKSIMGIFSLDLTKDIEVRCYNASDYELFDVFKPFMI